MPDTSFTWVGESPMPLAVRDDSLRPLAVDHVRLFEVGR
jgi:hypothetical protein